MTYDEEHPAFLTSVDLHEVPVKVSGSVLIWMFVLYCGVSSLKICSLLNVWMCAVRVGTCTMCIQMSEKGRRRCQCPGTGVIGSSGFWEPNSGPVQEQQMLLRTEPSLQPLWWSFESSLCIFG